MGNWRSFVMRPTAGPAGLDADVLARAPGWLWPHWAERELDPESPAFVPRGPLPALANVTTRNWTLVGNLASPGAAFVDPRGLVTPRAGGWSLDWWVGAEDRWHVPGREAAVRQSLAGDVPVVETAMRIPGGDAVERVYAVPATTAGGAGELVVVEVENLSPVPVAVAFALRPYNVEGLAPIGRVSLDDTTVLVDGRPALLLPRLPSGVAGSTLASGDTVHRVMAGLAAAGALQVEDPEGLAQAAFVYPLPHRTTVRVALPMTVEHPPGHNGPDRQAWRSSPSRRRPAAVPLDLGSLPAAADVTRGWQAQLRRGLRVELPDGRLQAAIDANRAALLLFHTGPNVVPAPWSGAEARFRDTARMIVTLDQYGFHTEAAEVLRSQPWRSAEAFSNVQGRQRGGLGGQSPPRRESRPSPADTGAALWAIAHHHDVTGNVDLLGELIPSIREAVRLLAAPLADRSYEEAFWSIRGLADAAQLLRLAGDADGGAGAEAIAARQRDSVSASLESAAAPLGRVAMPAAPGRGLDPGMIGSLVACAPLALLPPRDPWVAGTLDVVRERFCLGEAFYDPALSGLGPAATLQIAACELQAGEPGAWRRLRWLLDAASVTHTWPKGIHPRLGGGCTGDGHDGSVTAAFLAFVRDVLVRETVDGRIALATIFPPEWAGQSLEVHDAPTRHGRMSYALRWHGDRPALLWQCDRPGVTLTVPGLDPSFSTTEPEGETLLAPYRARIPIPLRDARA